MQAESRQGTPVYEALDLERQRFSSTSNQSSKEAMQQLYKHQLDSLMEEKSRQRQVERARQDEERRQFNEKAEQGKQAQRMKQVSYKNYYNMLMSNQTHNQQGYVSPFAKRENLKDALINRAIDDEKNKHQLLEQELRRRDLEKRNVYRNDLLSQIEERRRRENMKRDGEVREKQEFQRNSKLPTQIQRYEKEKHKEEVEKYRQDLDLMNENRLRSESHKSNSSVIRPDFHNPLTNPIPYNIQNPYILKEMGAPKNPSYLAMKGSQNLKLS